MAVSKDRQTSMKKLELICQDIDGVLSGFVTQAAANHGIPTPKDYFPENFLDKVIPDPAIFWSKAYGHDFWANLPLHPWANDLVNTLEESGVPWVFLTKASKDVGFYSGRYEWINKHFPQHVDKLWIVRGNKHLLARSNRLLIDDLSRNTIPWAESGGLAFQWRELAPENTVKAAEYIAKIKAKIT